MFDYSKKLTRAEPIKEELLKTIFNKNKSLRFYADRKFAEPKFSKINEDKIRYYQHVKRPQFPNFIIIDVDYITPAAWNNIFHNEYNLLPNYVISEYSKNKNCQTLQLFYILNQSYKTKNSKQWDLMKSIIGKLTYLTGGDICYQHATGIHKNPAYIKYKEFNLLPGNINNMLNYEILKDYDSVAHVLADRYTVKELLEVVKKIVLPKPMKPQKILHEPRTGTVTKKVALSIADMEVKEVAPGNRNTYLFDTVRLRGKATISRYRERQEAFAGYLNNYAKHVNNALNEPLPDNEVETIVESVVKYFTSEYDKSKAETNSEALYTEEQRQRSIQVRSGRAWEKIQDAIKKLKSGNRRVSAAEIKKISGQDIRLINRYLVAGSVAQPDFSAKSREQKGSGVRCETGCLGSVSFNAPQA